MAVGYLYAHITTYHSHPFLSLSLSLSLIFKFGFSHSLLPLLKIKKSFIISRQSELSCETTIEQKDGSFKQEGNPRICFNL